MKRISHSKKLTDGNGRNDESVPVEKSRRLSGNISAKVLKKKLLFPGKSLFLVRHDEFIRDDADCRGTG